jgi:hypothetical protein
MPTYIWSNDGLIPNDENAYGTSGAPAAVEFIEKLYLLHEGRGSDGEVWCATYDGQTWSDDVRIPNDNHPYGTSGPPAAAVYNDKLYCIREGRRGEGKLWWSTFDGHTWSRDAYLPNSENAYGTSGRPGLAAFNGKLYCVHEGPGDGGSLYCTTYDGTNWSNDVQIPNSNAPFETSGPPALAVFNGVLYCIREGAGNSGWVHCATFDGTNWSSDQLIPDEQHAYGTSGMPGLAVFNSILYCIREGRDNEGILWGGTFGGAGNWSSDNKIPNSETPFETSGGPGLAVFNHKMYCFHEGSHGDGYMWGAFYTALGD